MPKNVRPLSVKEIAAITRVGTTAVGGVPGLSVQVLQSGDRYFVYRYQIDGRRSMVSLGSLSEISLKVARERAAAYAELVERGISPVEHRRKEAERRKRESDESARERDRQLHTVAVCAEEWIQERVQANYWAANIRGESVMRAYFRNHINPKIGAVPIGELSPQQVFDLLRPLWQTTTDTAENCKSAVFNLFRWAKARGYCVQENPADIKGVLGVLLEPLQATRKKNRNLPALDYQEIPDFFVELMASDRVSYRMTAFAILTTLRSKMVRLAKWSDVNFQERTLTIPNANFKTKGRGDHTVFLSAAALQILNGMPRYPGIDLIFPSPRQKRELSDAAMGVVFARLHERSLQSGGKGWIDPVLSKKEGVLVIATQHGTSRASFKTWTKTGENRKLFDEEAVELCTAHKLQDDYGGAYNRATLEPERRQVMEAWGQYCFSKLKL